MTVQPKTCTASTPCYDYTLWAGTFNNGVVARDDTFNGDYQWPCGTMQSRFQAARAFGILTVLASAVPLFPLIYTLCSGFLNSGGNVAAGYAALGVFFCLCASITLSIIMSVIAMALVVSINTVTICPGLPAFNTLQGWSLSTGGILWIVTFCLNVGIGLFNISFVAGCW